MTKKELSILNQIKELTDLVKAERELDKGELKLKIDPIDDYDKKGPKALTDKKKKDYEAKVIALIDKAKSLKKAKVDEGKPEHQKQADRIERQGSWEKENLGTKISGHSKTKEIARFLHNAKLDQIKRSPKPNLPDVKKAVRPQPASVSDPLIVNTRGAATTEPRIINGPNVINSYKSEENSEVAGRMMALKDIVNHLKMRKK